MCCFCVSDFLNLFATLRTRSALFPFSVDTHGKGILTVIAGASVTDPGGKDAIDTSKNNVSYEARLLKRLYLKLRENM